MLLESFWKEGKLRTKSGETLVSFLFARGRFMCLEICSLIHTRAFLTNTIPLICRWETLPKTIRLKFSEIPN